MYTSTISDQTDHTRTTPAFYYDSAGPLTGIPSHNDIVAEFDNGMTVILQQNLSGKQPIHFMPTEVSDDTSEYVNDIKPFFDVKVPEEMPLSTFKIRLVNILSNTLKGGTYLFQVSVNNYNLTSEDDYNNPLFSSALSRDRTLVLTWDIETYSSLGLVLWKGIKETNAITTEQMREVAEYCIIDAISCQRLMVKRNAINEYRKVASVTFISLYDSHYFAVGMKVRNLLSAKRAESLKESDKKLHEINFQFNGHDIFAWSIEHENQAEMKGLYPKVLEELLIRRNLLKRRLAPLKDKKEELEKEIMYMNTFYGEAGNSGSPFFLRALAGGDTDSLYLICLEEYFRKCDEKYISEKISKEKYWEGMVGISIEAMNKLRGEVNDFLREYNGSPYLKMAYEKVLFLVVFTGKKKYYGISHTNLNGVIKTAVWKPDKNNKSVQHFILRMRDRHTCEEADAKWLIKKGLTPEPYLYEILESGECFEYIVVENDSSQRVGNKMKYSEIVRRLDTSHHLKLCCTAGALKKLKDGNKAGNSKVDDGGMDGDDLDEDDLDEDKDDEDKMDEDEISKIRDALAQKSAEKWIRGYIKSLRDEISEVDIEYRESMYKLVTKKRAMSLEQYLTSYYLDECNIKEFVTIGAVAGKDTAFTPPVENIWKGGGLRAESSIPIKITMRRYLRSDATLLSPETYSDIINAKGQIAHSTNAPNTPDTLRITDTLHRFNNLHTFFTNITDRARSVHSTDAFDTLHTMHTLENVIPDGAEKPSGSTDLVSEEGVISGSKTQLAPMNSEGLNINDEELNAFYEKEAKRDKKNKAEVNRLNPGTRVIGKLWTTPTDSTSTVVIPLRSYFMDLSMLAPMRNTISSVMIAISEQESNAMAGIFRRPILHFIDAMLVDGSSF
ncbi:hypothetical protein C1646_758039 [Rhizophagus diaphanus]|nr:hypothetical protein C1646_758039 [Rhizophagus diaphanus] [Rhizophagus sp. MUCL 43196]